MCTTLRPLFRTPRLTPPWVPLLAFVLLACAPIVAAPPSALALAASVAPTAPSDLHVDYQVSNTQLRLYFYDRSDNEDHFVIEREADGETTFTPVGIAPALVGTGNYEYFYDAGLAVDTTYTYRVRAVSADGTLSLPSNTDSGSTVPVPPSGLSAAPVAGTDDSVLLTWTDNSRHEDRFRIFRRGPSDGNFLEVGNRVGVSGTGSTVTYTDAGLDANNTYQYYVVASNGRLYSDGSNHVSASTNTAQAVPVAPSDCNVDYHPTGTTMRLYFYDRSTNEDSFTVEQKSEDDSAFSVVQALPALRGAGSYQYYTTPDLSPDTLYTFRVQAHNSVGPSAYSNISSGVTVPVPPVNLQGTAVGGSVKLTWTDNSRHEDYFRIFRKLPGATTFNEIDNVPGVPGKGNTVTYSDSTAPPSTNVAYEVAASNGAGYSAPSNVVTLTTNVAQTPPNAPSNCTVDYHPTGTTLRLYFYDQSTNEDGFTVQQKSEDNPVFSDVQTLPALAGAGSYQYYTTPDLAPDTLYTFQVLAYNIAGNSAPSNTSSGVTVPVPPSNLAASVTAGKDDTVALS